MQQKCINHLCDRTFFWALGVSKWTKHLDSHRVYILVWKTGNKKYVFTW